MTRLLAVEVRRIASRRIVRAFLLLSVLGIVIGATSRYFTAQAPTPAVRRAAIQEAEAHRQIDLRACSNGEFGIPANKIPTGMTLEQFCASIVGPVDAYVVDRSYHLTNAKDAMMGTNILLILLLGLLGASMIGAEWQAGTITTLLTWEPRRIRVLVAKTVVVAAFAFLASVLLQALIGVAVLPVALLRGTTTGANSAWFRSTVAVVLRGGLLAMLASVAGLAIASIARNTAFAIGAAFAWMAVIEPILRVFRPRWQPWYLTTNAVTFVVGTAPDSSAPGRGAWEAGLLVTIYVGAILLAALVVFRSRDVT
jgi:ABC-2 type transport system permease protein